MKWGTKIVLKFFVAILLLNSVLAVYPALEGTKKSEYSNLSKILGEVVQICNGSNTKGFYLSSFDRLDKEQHQKLKKQIDLAYSAPTSSDSKYINDSYSAYIAAVHNGSIRPFTTLSKPEVRQLSLKFSTAPPFIS